MYRINYSNPISNKYCSRTFKNLKVALRFIRDFSSCMTFEVCPIGNDQDYFVFYDLFKDEFIMNTNDDIQVRRKLGDINE